MCKHLQVDHDAQRRKLVELFADFVPQDARSRYQAAALSRTAGLAGATNDLEHASKLSTAPVGAGDPGCASTTRGARGGSAAEVCGGGGDSAGGGDEDADLCQLCHTAGGADMRYARCKHGACEACWASWLSQNLTCPFCRMRCRPLHLKPRM